MHRFLTVLMSAALLLTPIISAQSDEFPVLNVQPLCRGIASQADTQLQAGDRSVTIDECLKAEQVDRETNDKRMADIFGVGKNALHCGS
jgi:hypothetical protein